MLAWKLYNDKHEVNSDNITELLSQPLWLNGNYKNPYHYIGNWARKGIMTIRDLCNEQGFMSFDELKTKFDIKGTYMDLDYIFYIMPGKWTNIIRQSRFINVNEPKLNVIQKHFLTARKGSRLFYDALLAENVKSHTCQKWEYLFKDVDFDWHMIFDICKKTSDDVKLFILQYKFIHRVIYTKKRTHENETCG